ncbi:zinc finger MYM-type protein 1-like [Triticum urartu]|uniref:zinc finger MYM-type protein 1-like n=1 Tax=Triticum urartu TaxID=4572 RepID=UPI002043CCD7|nr:zinc finger MYM-type protein 1-like [Triticum urartu]XP_048530467.1 zinc finger MYM-type protein 1-like [Triticum urartu]
MSSPSVQNQQHLQIVGAMNTSPIAEPEIEHEASEESENIEEENDSEDAVYDVQLLEPDPGKRIAIVDYDVNDQNRIRRGYIAKGACRPKKYAFPQHPVGGMRRFVAKWFKSYEWLEYSKELDAAFCFVCYLFKDNSHVGGDCFVNGGFRNWNHKASFGKHVCGINNAHNKAQEKYNFFIAPKTTIVESFSSTTKQDKVLYIARLTYSLKCLRFLLGQGLAFRGHDEREVSLNKGNFLELLHWLAENFEEVNKVVLKNAPKNNKMIAHEIQTDLINSCAKETTRLMMEELGDSCFSILADESSDVYLQEQLALCLRYVDKIGRVVERFLGILHVADTTSLTLKTTIESLLMENGLTFSRVHGQGYDGASNMKGHVNGLKKLIMDESPSAYYVHCFAHQLQLSLVAVAKENRDCVLFFQQLANLLNVLGCLVRRLECFVWLELNGSLKHWNWRKLKLGKA